MKDNMTRRVFLKGSAVALGSVVANEIAKQTGETSVKAEERKWYDVTVRTQLCIKDENEKYIKKPVNGVKCEAYWSADPYNPESDTGPSHLRYNKIDNLSPTFSAEGTDGTGMANIRIYDKAIRSSDIPRAYFVLGEYEDPMTKELYLGATELKPTDSGKMESGRPTGLNQDILLFPKEEFIKQMKKSEASIQDFPIWEDR